MLFNRSLHVFNPVGALYKKNTQPSFASGGIYNNDMLESDTTSHSTRLVDLSCHKFIWLQITFCCRSIFFLSCLVMLDYYQGPSTSNIWEWRLKHQQFSWWVSSLARSDERSHCSPPADSPRHWPASSQSGRVTSCQACNANAMTGEPSGPF